jgi:hypothetical protein
MMHAEIMAALTNNSGSAVMANMAMITAALMALITRHVMSFTKPRAIRLLAVPLSSTLNMKEENQIYVSP